jgi:hypothetical protein
MRTSFSLGSLLLLGLGHAAAEPPTVALPEPELTYAENFLKGKGIGVDGPALVAFFKARTLTAGDQDRLAAAVRNLGDDAFDVREKASADLVTAGRLALTYLKSALKEKDPEVVCRAKQCIEQITSVPEGALVLHAAQVIGARRPDGATEALLACLPWLEDESLQEAVFQALVRTGLKDGAAAPEAIAAAKDKEPARRSAAAFVLGRGGAEARRAVAPLLKDADARVRFHAAVALVRAGDRSAVPPLFLLLTDSPPAVAWQAEDLLCRLAGEKAPAAAVGAGADLERRKARDAWEAWWKDSGDKLDLAKVNLDDNTFHSGVVIAELEGRVWEAGPDGSARWSFNGANRPIDARSLPGGRVLVAEHGANRVTERDRQGNILWQHTLTSQPVVCQRLPNGNTFIATYQEMLEVKPDKTVLYSHKARNGMIFHAEKMRDGRFVYVTSGNTVFELDADGKEVKTINTAAFGNTSGWSSVEKLPNGNYLIALYSNNKVVEVDGTGKVVWQCTAKNPGHAMRLRNGNTLVANIEGRTVVEYDATGKNELWTVKAPGRPFHAWRR